MRVTAVIALATTQGSAKNTPERIAAVRNLSPSAPLSWPPNQSAAGQATRCRPTIAATRIAATLRAGRAWRRNPARRASGRARRSLRRFPAEGSRGPSLGGDQVEEEVLEARAAPARGAQFGERSLSDQPPVGEDADTVGDALGDLENMRRQDDRGAFAHARGQQVLHLPR